MNNNLSAIDVIGIDLDGTLISTEKYYRRSEDQFFTFLKDEMGVSELAIAQISHQLEPVRRSLIEKHGFGVPLQHAAFMKLFLNFVHHDTPQKMLAGCDAISDRKI